MATKTIAKKPTAKPTSGSISKPPPLPPMALVVDSREGSEVELYYASLEHAPEHMAKRLGKNGQTTYQVYEDPGEPGSLDGLVNEELECAQDWAEEVWEFLQSLMVEENKFKPNGSHRIDYSIAVVAA